MIIAWNGFNLVAMVSPNSKNDEDWRIGAENKRSMTTRRNCSGVIVKWRITVYMIIRFTVFKSLHLIKFSLLFACWFFGSASAMNAQQTAPELFSYAELQSLYNQETLPPALDSKLNSLLTVPFVDNSGQSAAPRRLSQSPKIGEFLRVACWNIERGLEYEAIEAAFGGAGTGLRL